MALTASRLGSTCGCIRLLAAAAVADTGALVLRAAIMVARCRSQLLRAMMGCGGSGLASQWAGIETGHEVVTCRYRSS